MPDAYVGLATIAVIFGIGVINYFGPKHTGSFAVSLGIPMVVVILLIIGWSIPYLSLENLQPSRSTFGENWIAFVGVILALSGVEAIANLTGVMKLDAGPDDGESARRPDGPEGDIAGGD